MLYLRLFVWLSGASRRIDAREVDGHWTTQDLENQSGERGDTDDNTNSSNEVFLFLIHQTDFEGPA